MILAKMTKGEKFHRQHSPRDTLHGIQHRASRLMDQATLRRSYDFYTSKVMDDLCESVDVLHMQRDTESHMADHIHVDIRNDFDTTVDTDGDSLLHLAIILNQPHIALSIISRAPNSLYLSIQNNWYQAPIHLSALTNQPEVCRMLLAAGAEMESRDKDGNTALHIACRDGMLNIVVCFVNSNICTMKSVREPSKVQDLTIRNYSGYTCLHLAAMNGHTDIVETLIQNGADINMADGRTGRTILHDACICGDIKLVKTLLQYKSCNINARAYDDSTPLDFARDRDHGIICMTLAAAGARQCDSFTDSE